MNIKEYYDLYDKLISIKRENNIKFLAHRDKRYLKPLQECENIIEILEETDVEDVCFEELEKRIEKLSKDTKDIDHNLNKEMFSIIEKIQGEISNETYYRCRWLHD